MSQFNFLSAQIENKKKDYTKYLCPFCGSENKINSSECVYCRNSLLEFEQSLYIKYNKYNESLHFANNEDYISALENVIQFLEYYPDDVEGNRLKLFLLNKLKDKNFENKAEEYLRVSQDRWVAKLIDTPKEVSIKDLPTKEVFIGKQITELDNIFVAIKKNNDRTLQNLKETINSLYSMYIRLKSRKKNKDKQTDEFIVFYEKIFLLFLKKQDIQVIDYFNKNIEELSTEERKYIGAIDTISDKKLKNGTIAKVHFPEIRHNVFIVQKAKITVINNNKKVGEKDED
jgi:hypothetical protein